MRLVAYWSCAALALAVLGAMFYLYGMTPITLLLALLLLTCPLWVIWLTLRIARQQAPAAASAGHRLHRPRRR